MKETDKNKQLIINMAASLLSCLVSLGISFLITPTVIYKLGSEAQGFVTMANNFVSYAAIAAMALNSMAGRFITVKIHQNDAEGANRYFNSVMYANLVIVAVLLLPCTLVVLYLEKLVNISPALVTDVKLLFAAMFINFMVTIIATTFSTATFAANRLDLSALRTIESQILKSCTADRYLYPFTGSCQLHRLCNTACQRISVPYLYSLYKKTSAANCCFPEIF